MRAQAADDWAAWSEMSDENTVTWSLFEGISLAELRTVMASKKNKTPWYSL